MLPTSRRRSRRASERGLGLLEILVAGSFAAMALLVHAVTTLQGHQMARVQESRSVALETLREFIEIMRADDDWKGLYGRLRSQMQAAEDTGVEGLPPHEYYADFQVPPALGPTTILARVPTAPGPDPTWIDPDPPIVPVLREDVDAPAFGLPYDLNGDGQIDANPRDLDYRAIPVVFEMQWTGQNQIAQKIQVLTWLTGERQ